MSVKLLTEDNLEFLSLKGGCTGSSESTHVKMPHCWKSHAAAHMLWLALMSVVQNKHFPMLKRYAVRQSQRLSKWCQE